jgi:hypothetical protein
MSAYSPTPIRRRKAVLHTYLIFKARCKTCLIFMQSLCKGGGSMGKGMNTLKGKVTTHGAMYVESDVKSTSKKPTVKKGGDLRAKGDK